MDQRLDDTDLIHGQTIWTDTDGNLRVDNWIGPRPQPSMANCLPCPGCQVMVNRADDPFGWCDRCFTNKHHLAHDDRPVNEQFTQARPSKKMREEFNGNR